MNQDPPDLSSSGPDLLRVTKKHFLDYRFFILVVAFIFTMALLIYSMVMIAIGGEVSIWLPLITYSAGVWTGIIPEKARAFRQRIQRNQV